MTHSVQNEERCRLLIIDDEEEILKSFKRLFRKRYEIFTAGDADAAHDILRQNRIHVVLSDQRMPGTTGTEFLSKIRYEFPDVVRLILTGYSDIQAVVSALNDANIFRYVSKPWEPETLSSIIDEAYRFHLNLKNNKAMIKILKKSCKDLEIKVGENTSKLLDANRELQRIYEEKEQLIDRLEDMVKERTQALEAAQAELLTKERLAVLGHFAGSISHELRNPLAAIDASAYYLNMVLEDQDEKTGVHLGRIRNNVKKSTDIIQSLLSLSRMEKSKTEKRALNELISEILKSDNLPETVKVKLNFPQEDIFVAVDPEQIRMALKNIFKNAVQAMDETGELTVTINKIESGSAALIISDSGPGVSPENLDKVFEPLFSTKDHGIGFGLSIAKMIIENHGGTIRAESEPGSGAAFTITLPLAETDLPR